MSSEAFDKSLRLLNARDYKSVFDDAPIRTSNQNILILSRPNQKDHPRLGLVIAKKNIRLAVQRNRIKRILRESFRLNKRQLEGLDIVILARRGLDELDNPKLQIVINKQWQRLLKKKAQFNSRSN